MVKLFVGKKGDKIISVYWFAILFIVAAGIVYMVAAFYGNPYDVRAMEANALTNKVADCFSTGGYLNKEVLQSTKENFLRNCLLNFTTEDIYGGKNQGQYYLYVSIGNFTTGENLFSVEEGNINLKDSCSQKGKTVPACVQRSFYSIDGENNQYEINITSIVRKTEKNVE